MISVIVCSKKHPSITTHRNNITSTIGAEHEYIRVDNTKNKYGICAAYAFGVSKAAGDILVFVHEDVFFITQQWGAILHDKFSHDASIGCIGVAGTQYLSANFLVWFSMGRPFIKGRVVHDQPGKNKCIMTVFSEQEKDEEVVVVDGLFFAVRRSLFDTISFDTQTFDHFHFYDLDLCMQIRKSHRILVTSDIFVKHSSGGSFKEEWKLYGRKFIDKYKDSLPASCVSATPDPKNLIPFTSFPLHMLLSPKTYVHIKDLGHDPIDLLSGSIKTDKNSTEIIAITGMHRSGTSCVAGLLNACGLSLGPKQEMLNENQPKFDNQKGHFENLSVVGINDLILSTAGGSWCKLPAVQTLNGSGDTLGNHILQFNQSFDGSIIKDPRLCLTLDSWKKYCKRLKYVIICFRHPLGVAQSLQKRNKFPIEAGLSLWYEYCVRLIDNIEGIPVAVVDYDNLIDHLADDLHNLLQTLRISMSKEEMAAKTQGFFDTELNHNRIADQETETLPEHIKEIYQILKSQSLAVKTGRASLR